MIGKKVIYQHSSKTTGAKIGAVSTGVIYDKVLIEGNDNYLILNQNNELETVRCKDIDRILTNSRKV